MFKEVFHILHTAHKAHKAYETVDKLTNHEMSKKINDFTTPIIEDIKSGTTNYLDSKYNQEHPIKSIFIPRPKKWWE